MNWINLVWMGVGFGLGLAAGWFRWQPSKKKQSNTSSPSGNNPIQPAHHPSQLELAYQMASEMSQFKGGYLARISHELRSPLNGLIGMHQLILSDLCDSPEEEREFITQANVSARKMVEVLDRILDVARVEYGTVQLEIQTVPLAEIFQEVYDLTYLLAKDRNIRLQILPPDPEVYVQVDLPRFRQILIYLVDTAIQKLPEDGITISANLSTDSSTVQIWIDDQCSLASRSEPINLLQTEVTGDGALPPTGLNLLAVQTLLKMMQGRLEVVPVHAINGGPDGSHPSSILTRIQCSVPGYRK
ncbi:sensor histidine kinase [Leptothermofonsia sp. ETS-13]|uniref:sensor histidine kinase n=1 Tax=Leptothermofonsia sp. ETS-13 TaxID=3035696 RepID=UPI003BA3A49C